VGNLQRFIYVFGRMFAMPLMEKNHGYTFRVQKNIEKTVLMVLYHKGGNATDSFHFSSLSIFFLTSSHNITTS